MERKNLIIKKTQIFDLKKALKYAFVLAFLILSVYYYPKGETTIDKYIYSKTENGQVVLGALCFAKIEVNSRMFGGKNQFYSSWGFGFIDKLNYYDLLFSLGEPNLNGFQKGWDSEDAMYYIPFYTKTYEFSYIHSFFFGLMNDLYEKGPFMTYLLIIIPCMFSYKIGTFVITYIGCILICYIYLLFRRKFKISLEK